MLRLISNLCIIGAVLADAYHNEAPVTPEPPALAQVGPAPSALPAATTNSYSASYSLAQPQALPQTNEPTSFQQDFAQPQHQAPTQTNSPSRPVSHAPARYGSYQSLPVYSLPTYGINIGQFQPQPQYSPYLGVNTFGSPYQLYQPQQPAQQIFVPQSQPSFFNQQVPTSSGYGGHFNSLLGNLPAASSAYGSPQINFPSPNFSVAGPYSPSKPLDSRNGLPNSSNQPSSQQNLDTWAALEASLRHPNRARIVKN
ncbi:unnamed protein product [Caenorhabditis auriculariae]|uniref:Uncharacterized protein n=1 Tax=Caenorhabditis auriculariae TaxID=2777116 RepID=A0A8S1GVS0_9PELO|nr:unnamed protein product [Caenorhabditis auriculariae]